MFSIFKKKPAPSDPRDLEQLIFDVAEHQRGADFELLYRRMADRHVYVPIDPASLPAAAAEGERYQTQRGDRLKMRIVTGPNGEVMIACATCEDSSMLKDGFVGMEWRDFLQMVSKLDASCYGTLLQGQTSWVAFDRERIGYILSLR